MAFSAFHRFHNGASFSSREPVGRKIYFAMRAGLGESFDQSLNDNPVQARLFAQAQALARCANLIRRVKNNAIALKMTDLLPTMEEFYGVVPEPGSTLNERRRRLHARMQLSRGARREAVLEIVTTLVGDDFIAWLYADTDSLVRFPDSAEAAAALGNDVPPGTQTRILRTLGPITPGARVVAVEELTPAVTVELDPSFETPQSASKRRPNAPIPQRPTKTEQAMVGRTFVIDPGFIGRREHGTVTAVGVDDTSRLITEISATFTNPHDPGVLITFQYFPLWRSSANQHQFVLTDDAATDAVVRQRVDNELRRALRAISTWAITDGSEFAIDEGRLGITPLGES